MNTAKSRQAAILEASAPDIAAIREAIAIGMAVGQGREIVARMRELAGAHPQETLTLRLGRSDGGMLLPPNGRATPTLVASGRIVTLESLSEQEPALVSQLTKACQLTLPMAIVALMPFFEPGRIPTREEFEAVARWAPLIIKPAYRLATRFINLVESLRDEALRSAPGPGDPNPDALASYYGVLLSTAHLYLVASPPGGRPWMADMAQTFTWVNWTPSMGLQRERTLWLTAAAARSAAAFGPDVVHLYVDKLGRATHPVEACDALAGLVSIACSAEASFNDISRQVDDAHNAALNRDDPYLSFTVRAFRSATEALRLKADGLGPPPCLLRHTGWKPGSQSGLATPEAFRLDPMEPCDTGEMIGLLAIPTVLQTPLFSHYPVRVRNPAKLLPAGGELVEMVHRAWAPRRRLLH